MTQEKESVSLRIETWDVIVVIKLLLWIDNPIYESYIDINILIGRLFEESKTASNVKPSKLIEAVTNVNEMADSKIHGVDIR